MYSLSVLLEAFVNAAAPYGEGDTAVLRSVAVVDIGPSTAVAAEVPFGRFAVGAELDPAADVLVRRAQDPSMFVSAVIGTGDTRALALALAVGIPDTVVFAEFELDATAAVADADSAVFGEVKVALYTGTARRPADLILATTEDLPLTGNLRQEPVTVGADEWLVVVSARRPLSGGLARAQPYFVLGAGLILTLAVAALVETIGRRRDFAEHLVDVRTAELRAAQSKLVEAERAAAVGDMAATMAHELRNPLGVLTNVHYLLRSRLGGDDPVVRQLDQADREVGKQYVLAQLRMLIFLPRLNFLPNDAEESLRELDKLPE